METPAWLFLVLEYCPGQDLFFWLEQARDAEGIDGEVSRVPSRLGSRAPVPKELLNRVWPNNSNGHTSSGDNSAEASRPSSPPLGQSPLYSVSYDEKGGYAKEHTPPSPSLLAATVDTALLSRRRLRLISRMFVQMCEGLQTCHNAGVSHRDIKPENIIIVDNRAETGYRSGKVVIKITDWGLGTTDERCEDFDCGSKPYMAYGEFDEALYRYRVFLSRTRRNSLHSTKAGGIGRVESRRVFPSTAVAHVEAARGSRKQGREGFEDTRRHTALDPGLGCG